MKYEIILLAIVEKCFVQLPVAWRQLQSEIWEGYMAQSKPKGRGLALQIFPTTFGSEQSAPGE
jgi:hypothetical protein